MRRKDREVKDPDQIEAILSAAKICRLGIHDPAASAPYVVPLNYGYEWLNGKGGTLRLVFHGAQAGRKYDLLQANPCVGFELDASHTLISGDTACQYGASFQSVIGSGVVRFLEEETEKRQAIDLLMLCQAGKTVPIENDILRKTAVFELIAGEYSAKAR